MKVRQATTLSRLCSIWLTLVLGMLHLRAALVIPDAFVAFTQGDVERITVATFVGTYWGIPLLIGTLYLGRLAMLLWKAPSGSATIITHASYAAFFHLSMAAYLIVFGLVSVCYNAIFESRLTATSVVIALCVGPGLVWLLWLLFALNRNRRYELLRCESFGDEPENTIARHG